MHDRRGDGYGQGTSREGRDERQGGEDRRRSGDDRRQGREDDRGDRRRSEGGRAECRDRREGGERSDDRPGQPGRGPDTRFLQMEVSQRLVDIAESLTGEVFKALLAEEIRAELRDRLGGAIADLARTTVDSMISDLQANLAVETRIQERSDETARVRERLRETFGKRGEEPGSDDETSE